MSLFNYFIYCDLYGGKLTEKYACFFKKIEILGQQWLLCNKWLLDYPKTSWDKAHGYTATSVQPPFKFCLYLLKPSLLKVMIALLKFYKSYMTYFFDLFLATISGKLFINQRLALFIENLLFKVKSLLNKLQSAKNLLWQYFESIDKKFRSLTKQILTLAIVVDDLFLLWSAFCATLMKLASLLQVTNKNGHKSIVCIASFLKGLYTEFSNSIFNLRCTYQLFL